MSNTPSRIHEHQGRRGEITYHTTVSGNIGYWRQAIAMTPGTHEGTCGAHNGKAGGSNTITVVFDRNDEALHDRLRANYKQVCQEKKKAPAPVQAPPQPKVGRRFQTMLDRLLIEEDAYREFLGDVADDAEYGAWLDHVHTPSAEEY